MDETAGPERPGSGNDGRVPGLARRLRAAVLRLLPHAAALAIGAAGGAVFAQAGLPLAWMLGAMTFCLAAALLRAPLAPPEAISPPMRCVLGVLLGAAFTPAVFAQAGEIGLSLAFIVPYVVVVGLIGVPYFRRVAGFDTPTAYFAAMPGGLNDMVVFTEESGGDVRAVSLIHAARILLIVFTIPVFARWSGDDVFGGVQAGVSLADVGWREAALLVAAGAVGWPLARAVGLPGAAITGPMLASAALHLAGLSAAKPPDVVVAIAQVVLGANIGCRFAGVRPREVARILALASGLVVILLFVTAGFALGLAPLLDREPVVILLAYAPGGLAEMSLVALALGVEVAYVASHHVVRIMIVIVAAPLVFRRIGRRARPPAEAGKTGGADDAPPPALPEADRPRRRRG